MKNSLKLLAILALPLTVLLNGCDKEEDYPSDALNEYVNITPGKFIRYKMDSLRFVDYGRDELIVSYEAKDVVDAKLDDVGPNSWRIVRYYRPWGSTNESDWVAQMAYSVNVSREEVRVLEDNLNYIRLKLPIREGFTWYGNSMLPQTPFGDRYQFSNDGNIRDWEYTYENVNQPVKIENVDYTNTVTVLHVADSSNAPVTDIDLIGYRTYSAETYAKGIGLISKETVMWEYQPKNGELAAFKTGFGIRLSIIGHN